MRQERSAAAAALAAPSAGGLSHLRNALVARLRVPIGAVAMEGHAVAHVPLLEARIAASYGKSPEEYWDGINQVLIAYFRGRAGSASAHP